MRSPSYYIIRGKPQLKVALAHIDAELQHELMGPLLLENLEGGRTAHNARDYVDAVKILFITYAKHVLLKEYDRHGIDDDSADHVFDRYWDIERFDGVDYSTETMLSDLVAVSREGDIPPILKANIPKTSDK